MTSSLGERTQHRGHRAQKHRGHREEKKCILFVTEPAVENGRVGVDAAVAEEGPVAARLFALGGGAFARENFFFVVGSFGNEFAQGVADRKISPELQSRAALLPLALLS